MRFLADLHIHSRFSRATSRSADLPNYFRWARIKGIHVVGTGDCTHPAWFSEIRDQLIEEDGLLRFREEPTGPALSDGAPAGLPVRFLLSAEISSIYKKKGATRKVHSLLLVPGLDAAQRLGRKLATIGNVASDGRPILGLDVRDLLAILLEISPQALLIPAHIWTPWFSVFGSKSGFDVIEDCFEDLTPLVPALETGLSSDPPMNWRWSALDRFRLVSNSDAHSPPNLGREANLFETEMSFEAIRRALTTGEGFRGTFEFYPEEGKYHVDGHRKCGVRMDPEETARRDGLCPVCARPVTVGVLHRVLALADRTEAKAPRPGEGFRYLVPLPEILAELRGCGPGASVVTRLYERLISAFGNEFALLFEAPLEEVEARFGGLLAEAIRRMREGRVSPTPGYDGEFGTIRVFSEGEIQRLRGQEELFGTTEALAQRRLLDSRHLAPGGKPEAEPAPHRQPLDPEQESASSVSSGAVLVFAGPGAGKTRMLAHWISRLLLTGKAQPAEVLAVTFTNRAAGELRSRLSSLAGAGSAGVLVATFHSLCFSLLRERDPSLRSVYGARDREDLLRMILPGGTPRQARTLAERIEGFYEGTQTADEELAPVISAYEGTLSLWGTVDLSSLVHATTRMLRDDSQLVSTLRNRFRFIAVDELQDINAGQFDLLGLLARPEAVGTRIVRPRGVLCIGDPDQAIYGFRGSDRSLFYRFRDDFNPITFHLSRNYRSSANIMRGASSVLAARQDDGNQPAAPPPCEVPSPPALSCVRPPGERIRIFAAANPEEEGMFVGQTIRDLMGGVDSISAHVDPDRAAGYSFSDFAVLFRTRSVRDALLPSLLHAGLPVTFRESAPLCMTEPFTFVFSALRFLDNPQDVASLARLLAHLAPEKTLPELWSVVRSVSPQSGFPAHLAQAAGLPAQTAGRLQEFGLLADNLQKVLAEGGVAMVVERLLGDVLLLDGSDEELAIGKQLLLETAQESGNDLSGFVGLLSTLTVESEGPIRTEKILLLTFHAAKGLEFPVIFLTGVEEGITPLPEDLDEERRLFYVAMTRAADRLFISHCSARRVFGHLQSMRPSRFLDAIPAECSEGVTQRVPKGRTESQLSLFP